jgi:hypothetical protein
MSVGRQTNVPRPFKETPLVKFAKLRPSRPCRLYKTNRGCLVVALSHPARSQASSTDRVFNNLIASVHCRKGMSAAGLSFFNVATSFSTADKEGNNFFIVHIT